MRTRTANVLAEQALDEALERLISEDDWAGLDEAIDERRHHWWCLDTRCRGCAVERGGW